MMNSKRSTKFGGSKMKNGMISMTGLKRGVAIIALASAGLFTMAGPALADYEDAVSAFHDGEHQYAEDLWLKYASAGDIRSKYALGDLYTRQAFDSEVTVTPEVEQTGSVSRTNLVEGLAWYILAANHDFDSYQQRQVSFEEVNAKIKAQERVLELKESLKNKDVRKAQRRVENILSSGSAFDLYRLGRMYQSGAGLEKDNVKALQFYMLSNTRNPRSNTEASIREGDLKELMSTKDKARAQKKADEWVAPTPHQEASPRQQQLQAQIAELQLLRAEQALENIEPEFKNNDHLIQSALAALGYRPGKVDGKIGPDTRDAIRSFQSDLRDDFNRSHISKKSKDEDDETEETYSDKRFTDNDTAEVKKTKARFMKPCSDVQVTGTIVPCQKVLLIQWAAEKKHPRSQYVFGLMHAKGIGLPVNGKEAASYLEEAAAYGSALAHFSLGEAYRDGISGDEPLQADRKKASFHFGQSAALGYKPARKSLKELEYDFNLPPDEQ